MVVVLKDSIGGGDRMVGQSCGDGNDVEVFTGKDMAFDGALRS